VELASALADGTYQDGDALPSEPELMRRYALSRSTVRRALERLEQEGRVLRRHGSGTYATTSGEPKRIQFGLSNLMDSARSLESTTTTRWLAHTQIPTPPRILKLIPEFGATALHLERTRLTDGQPLALLSAYVRPKWARKLTRKAIGNRSIVVTLSDLGTAFSIVQQFYSAIVADRRLARHLGTVNGTALIHVTSVFRETSGHISHCEEWLLRPDLLSPYSIIDLG
jgi:GntR family transcriptional regulator